MSTPIARAAKFHVDVTIDPGDFDDLGHVNNAVYLRWVQEAAGAHWQAIAPADALIDLAWVVRRHEIDYRQPIVPGDTVGAATWVGAAEGLLFERHTEIFRLRDSAVLARARTFWCPVDAGTGKPKRVTPQLRSLFSIPDPGDSIAGSIGTVARPR